MSAEELTAFIVAQSNELATQLLLLQHLRNFYDEEEEESLTLVLNYSLYCSHPRIDGYFEDWVPRYLDQDFFYLYRMKRESFAKLLVAINLADKQFTGGHEPVATERMLLLTLWWLGKGETLISVYDRFGVALSTVYNITEVIIERLLLLKSDYIVWPDRAEIQDIERGFRERSGYPRVVGAIDGSTIKFKAPLDQQDSYLDKDMNHSFKLQGIVSSTKIFTNINVGYPGSVHDSRVFQNSSLYRDITENDNLQKYFHNFDYHLIGDKAYPLLPWMMTPYKNTGNFIDVKRHHNYCHSVTRIVVEHTFGILKNRWRILQFINVNSVVKAVKIITACCVLHNFCYVNVDFLKDYDPEPEGDYELLHGDVVDANLKRDAIANDLL